MNDDADVRLAAPFLCLFVVIMTAFLWGRLEAILGGAAANVTFCIFLFPPVGSLRLSDPKERVAAIAFQLIAIGAAFLAPAKLTVEGSYLRGRNGRGK